MNGVTELKNLLRQKTWDKDVVLWLGSDAALKDALSLCNTQELDILDLFDPDKPTIHRACLFPVLPKSWAALVSAW